MKLDFSKDGRFSLGFLHFAPSADDDDSFNLGKESIQTQFPNCPRNMAPNEGLLDFGLQGLNFVFKSTMYLSVVLLKHFISIRTRALAQKLRTLAGLLKDLGLFPRTHIQF